MFNFFLSFFTEIFDNNSFLDVFFSVSLHSFVTSVKCFSFFLEDFNADFLMLFYTINIELSSTSFTAHSQPHWSNLRFIHIKTSTTTNIQWHFIRIYTNLTLFLLFICITIVASIFRFRLLSFFVRLFLIFSILHSWLVNFVLPFILLLFLFLRMFITIIISILIIIFIF